MHEVSYNLPLLSISVVQVLIRRSCIKEGPSMDRESTKGVVYGDVDEFTIDWHE